MSYFKKRHSTYLQMVRNGKANTDGGIIDLQTYKDFLKTDFWKTIRKTMLKHRKNCFICGYGKKLEVHHISYKGMFKPDRNQLIVLCRKHHEEVEKIPYKYRSSEKYFHIMQRNYKNRQPLFLGLKDRYLQLDSSQKGYWDRYFRDYPNGIFTRK